MDREPIGTYVLCRRSPKNYFSINNLINLYFRLRTIGVIYLEVLCGASLYRTYVPRRGRSSILPRGPTRGKPITNIRATQTALPIESLWRTYVPPRGPMAIEPIANICSFARGPNTCRRGSMGKEPIQNIRSSETPARKLVKYKLLKLGRSQELTSVNFSARLEC